MEEFEELTDVAIVGVGCTGFKSVSPEVSYKELMFEAATRAYQDAGNINPRKDIDAFISVAEDYWEGFSIFDEFVPDQLGAVLRQLFTVSGDSIIGLGNAHMLIKTGHFDVVAVESHGKPSDILTLYDIVSFAMDPVFNRPLGGHPFYLAGLEMNRFLFETGNTKEDCAMVAVKNRDNALRNPYAAYGARIDLNDVFCSSPHFYPLNKFDISQPARSGSEVSDGQVKHLPWRADVSGKQYTHSYLPKWPTKRRRSHLLAERSTSLKLMTYSHTKSCSTWKQ